MKQRKNIIIVLIVIGVVLIFSAIRSVYYTYKRDKTYESKGYKTTTATLIQENSYIKGTEHIRYYQRTYLYTVSGQEYTFNTIEVDSKPYKTIKYNSINPNEAETYEGLNTETIVVFLIGIICIFSHFILKFINTKKISELKDKILKMSKRNIIKIVTACFCGYLGFSLVLALKELFLPQNLSQIITQYSKLEIIVECFGYILARCNFKQFTNYFIIFGI